MEHSFFFGYGSLVNRQTHGYVPAHRATATGWRRAWRFTKDRQVSFLTVIRDPGCTIDGLIAHVPDAGWPGLDQREAAYDRLTATSQVSHPLDPQTAIAIYAIPPNRLQVPDNDHPVLLSYLDVVVQGYLTEFGKQGVAQFFDTTTGWNAPILDDRDAPRYPRAQALGVAERALVDAALVRLDCRLTQP